MAPVPTESSFLWTCIKLVLVISIAGGFAYAVRIVVKGIRESVNQVKSGLEKKGVSITKDGVAVKTDKRAMTLEETQDKLQSGIMKGWKNSQFNVPTNLQWTTNLGGSRHDKQKEEYEAKYGAKKK